MPADFTAKGQILLVYATGLSRQIKIKTKDTMFISGHMITVLVQERIDYHHKSTFQKLDNHYPLAQYRRYV